MLVLYRIAAAVLLFFLFCVFAGDLELFFWVMFWVIGLAAFVVLVSLGFPAAKKEDQ